MTREDVQMKFPQGTMCFYYGRLAEVINYEEKSDGSTWVVCNVEHPRGGFETRTLNPENPNLTPRRKTGGLRFL